MISNYLTGHLRLSQTSRWSQMTSVYLRLADDLRWPQTSDYITSHLRLSQTSRWSKITSNFPSSPVVYRSSQVKLRLADDLRLPQISDHIRLLVTVLSGYLTGHLRLSQTSKWLAIHLTDRRSSQNIYRSSQIIPDKQMISDDLSLSQTSRWSQMTSDLRLYHRSSQIISD